MIVPLIALSTVSVYPESTAHGFAYAATVGYDVTRLRRVPQRWE